MRFSDEFVVRIRSDVRRIGDDVLLGGSPLRTMRLSQAAQRLLDGDVVRVRDELSDALAARLVDANIADPVLDSIPASDPGDLTVVIPVRDSADQLDRALAPLHDVPCIVVDDDSTNPAEIARVAAEHGADLIRLAKNVGPAGARNAGLVEVTTPYVAFVDADVVADSSTLLRLCRHFSDSNVAVVAPAVRSRARSAQPRWFERFDEQHSSLSVGQRSASVHPGAAVAWVPSACLVARTADLGSSFTVQMRIGEDVDLVWRMVAAGYSVRYDASEVALHETRTTVRAWLGRKFVYGTGGADLAKRHGRLGAPAVLTPVMAAAAGAVLMRRWYSVPAGLAGVAYSARALNRRLPESPLRGRIAVQLSATGLGWAVRQEAALVLRHWWPITAIAAIFSGTVRRAVGTAFIVDAIADQLEHPETSYAPVSRRLDDMAYGAGLWVGAWRHRSVTALLPRRPGSS